MNEDKKSKVLGILLTLLLHILLGVLLWLAHFGVVQHEEESGILVMVGVDADAGGEEMMASEVTELEPETQPEDVPPTPATSSPAAEPVPSPTDPVLTQEDAEAPYAAEQREKELEAKKAEEARLLAQAEAKRQEELKRQQEAEARKKQIADSIAKVKAEQEAKRKAAIAAVSGAFAKSGNGSTAGTQGSVNGNSSTGAVSGSPGYGTYDLGGRGMVGSLPRPAFDRNTSGKVVVLITVDAAGVVKSVTIGQGTTISDLQIRNAAKEAALKARFKAVSGNSLTPGTITYTFDSNN